MSNLKNKLSSLNKKASISSETLQKANEISNLLKDAKQLMDDLTQSFEASGNELAEQDYNLYKEISSEFEKYNDNLNEMELYLSNFSRDPGF